MRSIANSLLLLALAASGRADAAQPLLASVPVDPTVFRDGEVRRSTEAFEKWTLVCDTVARLGQKFCSLQSDTVPMGVATTALIVSTGDDGRPAALLRLPFGLSLPYGVTVEPLNSRTGSTMPSGIARHVPIALCGAADCEAVWTLRPDEITALRSGQGLRLGVRAWRFGDAGSAVPPFTATVSSAGFAGAIKASLR